MKQEGEDQPKYLHTHNRSALLHTTASKRSKHTHARSHGRHEGIPGGKTRESRRCLENGTGLVSSSVDGPAHHSDGGNGDSDGFEEEEGAELSKVGEAD